ncbi:MAG: zf-HC2 domain-containing protein [Inquilinus sp.]|nr:zf-HC2 domain-containing protein [Inquilinus sp.]
MPSRPLRRIKGMILKRMPLMVTCEEFESFILAYLEDELPRRQRVVFEFHLKICRECRDYLAAYRRTVELGRAAFADPSAAVPDTVPEDLIAAVLDARDA